MKGQVVRTAAAHPEMENQTVMIKDIRQGMKNLVMTVIVLDIGPAVQVKEREVRTLKVADGTACINLSLWGDAGNHIVPGDIIRLSKAHVNVYRNCVTLLNGKACEIDKVGEFCMVFNEQLNMSEPNLELSAGACSGKNGGGPPLAMGPPQGGNKAIPPRGPVPPPQSLDSKGPKMNNNGGKPPPQRVGGPKGPPRPDRR
ncbi:hypothetical protein GE061_012880 [Apolygus lucorum]|uniref:OB domain-containing protein n=1 Tax=Apolygus lucorum TaxID=248454 RepID=A0A8S9XVR4_APOLU|nr:hypothetical protein GE061_012880 [Apolygus lucorum]